ncbi:MAG: hypothetical protein QOF01_1773 [Thermomicrobiales bacterium]|jgi:Uma2 family endonuclease|nr:hypothetical protein [Thermomicrobiales bacterium]
MVLTASLDRPLTYDDLVTLPDDGTRCEPIGGEIYALPSPNPFHQLASGILFSLLRDFALVRQLGLVFAAPSMSDSIPATSSSRTSSFSVERNVV